MIFLVNKLIKNNVIKDIFTNNFIFFKFIVNPSKLLKLNEFKDFYFLKNIYYLIK